MALSKEVKSQIVTKFKTSELDTGSSHIQVALLTQRIKTLTEHFKVNKQDTHGRLGLTNMVSKRKKLLSYLKRTNLEQYTKVIAELGLRK